MLRTSVQTSMRKMVPKYTPNGPPKYLKMAPSRDRNDDEVFLV